MELITFDSEAFASLMERLERIERIIGQTVSQLQAASDELEMTTADLMNTLQVSESTLYRWRKRNMVHFRYLESGEVRYSFNHLYASIRGNGLKVCGMTTEEAIARLNEYREKLLLAPTVLPSKAWRDVD